MPSDADRVWITDVGPRDGLQNESIPVLAADKVALINALADAGVTEIEATAFVRASWVPQLADATQVMQGIVRHPGTTYTVLVPNEQGLARAIEAQADKVAVFTAASETFSQRNTNASVSETLDRFTPVFAQCLEVGLPIRAYVSTAVACPYEGVIAPKAVAAVVTRLLALGPCEIDLGDTIGAATPTDIDALLDAVGDMVPVDELVLHLHDTGGQALACAQRAIERGVRRFDSACGGLGGCPYAPGAPGNVSTSSLIRHCTSMGLKTGIDANAIDAAAERIAKVLGR
jgi:hydroxymethylglutaryl-CoA lyase